MPKKTYISGRFFNLETDKEIYEISDEVMRDATGIVDAIKSRIAQSAKNIKKQMKGSIKKTPRDISKPGRPSFPGNPPAIRTGNLYDNIEFELRGKQAEVGVTTAARYAKYLESGAVRKHSVMLPRPFLQPAVEKEWPDMINRIEWDIKRIIGE